MAKVKFPYGRMLQTAGIAHRSEQEPEFNAFCHRSITRHLSGDWGDLDDEDKKYNDDALKHGDRLLSMYLYEGTKVYVITECDRSVTTILFADEY